MNYCMNFENITYTFKVTFTTINRLCAIKFGLKYDFMF